MSGMEGRWCSLNKNKINLNWIDTGSAMIKCWQGLQISWSKRKKPPATARPLLGTITFVKEGQRLVLHNQASGFPAQSVWNLMTKVGLSKAAVRRLGEAADSASCWLWHKREDTNRSLEKKRKWPGVSLQTCQLEGVVFKARNTQRRLGTTLSPLFSHEYWVYVCIIDVLYKEMTFKFNLLMRALFLFTE